MKRLKSILAAIALIPPGLAGGLAMGDAKAAERGAPADTLTAREAMVRLPADVLDLLTESMRRDMLDWYDNDSIAPVLNTMEGISHLERPVTDGYLRMQVTPVTTLTLRILPDRKLGQVVMTLYTIGDSLQAKDTDIRFYDPQLRPLPRDKFIRVASTEDFLDTRGLDRGERDRLLAMVPFPTVEYTVGPDSDVLTARLTVGDFMSREAMEELRPHLVPEVTYRWHDGKYRREDNHF